MGKTGSQSTAGVEITDGHSTVGEEIANSITHGIGALLSIPGLVILIVLAVSKGDAWNIVGFTIFGATLIILYTASTLYHSLAKTPAIKVFQILDRSAIFLLIAGTYTPFLLDGLRGARGWSLFGVIWGLSIIGIILNSIWLNRVRKISLAVYLLMGWLIIINFKGLFDNVQQASIILLIIGGLSYSGGVVFFAWRRLPFNHMVWHLFVLLGSVSHYFAVWYSI
ncbi:MAG: hemolysin III family protein [Deltaproteobacteria bacterium]|nr:hemolysin III family protein [Deltaproteobacteria bacterium]